MAEVWIDKDGNTFDSIGGMVRGLYEDGYLYYEWDEWLEKEGYYVAYSNLYSTDYTETVLLAMDDAFYEYMDEKLKDATEFHGFVRKDDCTLEE